MQSHGRRGRGLIIKLVLAGAMLAGATMGLGVTAVSATRASAHCVVATPAGPLDLNEFYDVSVRIVIPPCNQIGSGEQWTVGLRWFVNHTFDAVADGFVQAGATPLDDFIAKFSAVKYVIDPGTTAERTYVFPSDDDLFVGTLAGFPFVNSLTLGTLRPLSVGPHIVDAYWSFSAMHCDGFFATVIGDSIVDGGSCIPAGEHLAERIPFTVTPDQQ